MRAARPILLLLLVLPAILAACRAAPQPPAETAAQAIEAAMAADRIPGMAVAVQRGDAIVWSRGFGLADREANAPARPQTLFRLGSVAKPMTATLAVRLAQRGLIDLDRPIRDYLPEWPARHPPVTLRQLLGHLGGVRHYVERDEDPAAPGGPIDLRRYPDRESILAVFADDDLVAPPGERFVYSTFGYALAGEVIEGATGRDYYDLLREHVLDPAGIEAIFVDDPSAPRPGLARFYDPGEGAEPAVVPAAPLNPAYKVPGGGLIGDAVSVARFGAMHFAPVFLEGKFYRQTFTSQRTRAGEETGTGLGWRIGIDGEGRTYYFHSGSQQGCRAFLLVYPAERLSLALLSNLGNRPEDVEPLALRIAGAFLEQSPP